MRIVTEKEVDDLIQLRAELAVERKKRQLFEAQLLELLELLAPYLNSTREKITEENQALASR